MLCRKYHGFYFCRDSDLGYSRTAALKPLLSGNKTGVETLEELDQENKAASVACLGRYGRHLESPRIVA